MSAFTFVNSTLGSAILGTLATKLFDSIVTSKFIQKSDKKKWLREKKLNLFSQLCEELLNMNCQNLEQKRKTIKEISLKIILLAEDKNLKTNLKNYLFILEEYKCYERDINLQDLNDELVHTLGSYMKKL